MAEYSPGLEGIIAAETSICAITEAGLTYRGYPVADLVAHCSFEDVAYLLLYGELPDPEEANRFRAELFAARQLPGALPQALRAIPPEIAPMDALRTAVSLQSHFDPDVTGSSREANLRKAVRLLAQIPGLIGEWQRRRADSAPPAAGNSPDESHAAYLLRQVTGRVPDPDEARLLDASLILYAEHELNASTFAARVVASTLSDLHSGVVAGIGALKGPLHGGANEKAMEVLLEVGEPENAEAWVRDRLARKERIMGFGHRVVRQGDSRAIILRDLGAELAEKRKDTRWLRIADTIQAVVEQEKGLKPNLDFPCAWSYRMLGIPIDLYTPLFVAARVVGWSAHMLEQWEHNRLIRPRAEYTGPALRRVTQRAAAGSPLQPEATEGARRAS